MTDDDVVMSFSASDAEINATRKDHAAKSTHAVQSSSEKIKNMKDHIRCVKKILKKKKETLMKKLTTVWTELKNELLHQLLKQQNTIERQIDIIFKAIQKSSASAISFYANVLKRDASAKKNVFKRLNREITIICRNLIIEQKDKLMTLIVHELNEQIKETTSLNSEIVAAKRLLSEDLIVTAKNENIKNKLKKLEKWVTSTEASSKIQRKRYTMLTKSVHLHLLDSIDSKQAIRTIEQQNSTWETQVKITHVKWMRRSKRYERQRETLIVNLATLSQTNHLIDEEILLEREYYDVELFHANCLIQQCFNCRAFDHIEKFCRDKIKCEKCAAVRHLTDNCSNKDNERSRCVNCIENHSSWDSRCLTREKKQERVKKTYATRSKRYNTNEVTVTLRKTFSDDHLSELQNEKSRYVIKSQDSQTQRKRASVAMKKDQTKRERERSKKMLTRTEEDENINDFVNQSQQTQDSIMISSQWRVSS